MSEPSKSQYQKMSRTLLEAEAENMQIDLEMAREALREVRKWYKTDFQTMTEKSIQKVENLMRILKV